ncbi:MAG: sulfotransferase family protein [Thermoanaerobaculia bacterium]
MQSVRWLGGELAEAQVRVCVEGEIGRGFRRAFERYGAEVRAVSRDRVDGKRRIFPADWETDREMLLLLDPGAVVVQDPLPWMRRGSFHRGDSGLTLVPSASLPLDASPFLFTEAPVELDFQLDLSQSPPEGIFAIDPAILRYGDHVDSEGYLLHSPYPFAQVRIEAFNRRLRQEREGRPAPARQARERPAPPAAPAAQVAVLGMHRSGTSALTSLLRLMGLWAGEEEDFPPPDDHNQAGYWEHRGVWSIDEAILQTLGASWSGAADLDLSSLGEGLRGLFRERAREIVQDLDRHGPWVVKDPRLCLLFPFWREILERPFCVLIYREPLPVARSLAARDGFPIPYGIALWELYTRQALAATRGLPRVLISHRELMADPAATLHRLHHHLARHRPELACLRVPAAGEIRAVLDPALVHHAREPEAERSYLTPPQLDLLDALADGSALGLDPVPPLSAGARDLLTAHQDQIATIRLLRDHLAVQTDLVASLRQAQDELAAARQSALASGEADLHRALSWLDELDAIFSATLDSRSWQIGRAATTVMRSLLGGSRISSPERRDRLMAEVRQWRKGAEPKED